MQCAKKTMFLFTGRDVRTTRIKLKIKQRVVTYLHDLNSLKLLREILIHIFSLKIKSK